MSQVKLLVTVQENLLAQGIKTLIDHLYNFTTHPASLPTKERIVEYCKSHRIDVLILNMDHTML